MTTFDELLNLPAAELKQFNDEQLLAELGETIKLEPRPIPKPLVKQGEELEEKEQQDTGGCPIKAPKKKKKNLNSYSLDELDDLMKDL